MITEPYRQLNSELHHESEVFGNNAWKNAPMVEKLARKYGAKSILDYGCGKASLHKELSRRDRLNGTQICDYDPALDAFSERNPADIVVCIDVLEHVELDCLHEVLADLRALTKKCLFLDIATRPSKKILPDGRNAHLNVADGPYWLKMLDVYFHIIHYENPVGNKEVYMECI